MRTFNITIDMLDNITGLNAISLVENPAVEYDFLAFSKPMVMQFADDEKHIITGVALLADTPIMRVDADGSPYQVVFSKEVIKQLVEKYAAYNLNNNVNIHHNDDMFVDGVYMIESYIVDKERGICPVEFSEVPNGSWITSYKVENEEVWEKIKSGEVKGFSVQGIFSIIERNEFNKINKNKINTKMSKLKEKIMNLLMEFNSLSTDKAELFYEEDTELMVGYKVFIEGEEGRIPAPDGEYISDENKIKVEGGIVTEIEKRDEPKEEIVEEGMACGKKKAIKAEEEEIKEEVKEEVKEEIKEEPIVEEPIIDEKEERIIALENKVGELEKIIAELIAKIEEIAVAPAAEPVAEEFEKASVPSKVTKSADKYINMFNSLRK